MSGRRYPDYYQRKRRRESTYRRIVTIVVGVVLCIVIGGGTGFLVWNTWIKPKRITAAHPADQAEQREELDAELRIADAQSNQTPVDTNADQQRSSTPASTELSEVDYSPSLPAIKVSIEGSNQPATSRPVQEEQPDDSEPEESAAGNTPTPPAEQEQPATFTPPAEGNANNSSSGDDKPDEVKPEEDKSEPEPEKPATRPAGSLVFHVYAGACSSKDEAEKMKSNLGALGFQATVIANNVDFLVRVASLEDYDSANALVSKLSESGFGNAFATRSRT